METLQPEPSTFSKSKVPAITLFFWIIKVLCTTVGETASDFLNVNLGLGLTGTSLVMGFVLLVVLFLQFRATQYIPGIYWLTVVLISVFGTLVTDNLTDKMGIPLEISTIVFTVALGLTFLIWFLSERTLSIHSIFTRRREAFYWLTILFTFALGTATGDLMAESLGLGYFVTGLVVCGVIVSTILAWKFGLDQVLSFWIAYIMTRPLGASIGDFLSQSPAHGGLGLGPMITSAIFLAAILGTVIFLTITKKDLIQDTKPRKVPTNKKPMVFGQTVLVLAVLAIMAVSGYFWRQSILHAEAAVVTKATQALSGTTESTPDTAAKLGPAKGDFGEFRTIAQDTLRMMESGDVAKAKSRVDDLETTWDQAQSRLKPKYPQKWDSVDSAIDKVLRQLRAINQNVSNGKSALESLIAVIDTLDMTSGK